MTQRPVGTPRGQCSEWRLRRLSPARSPSTLGQTEEPRRRWGPAQPAPHRLLAAARVDADHGRRHEYDQPVQKYVISELDSGERVITERLSHVRSVALGYWIGAGARDERDDRAGVSHFIEHLLFKGTDKYSAQEIAEVFDGLGGELNAATSREHTVVYARVADQHL